MSQLRISILPGTDWERSSDEEVPLTDESSGGVMLVFIVRRECDVCDTTCCCVLFKC